MGMLKFRVLGSAACEAVPAYFCSCPVCEYARLHGGRDRRSRTAYALGETVRFDFGPDALTQSARFGLRGENLEHLFFTHSHEDHLYCEDLCGLDKFERRLQIYGNAAVIRQMSKFRYADKMVFHELSPGDKVELPTPGLAVTALEADHIPTETALLYLLERGDRRILIANDTAPFPESTYELLRGKLCRHIFIDCTWGDMDRTLGHMGLPNNLAVLARLRDIGAADGRTVMHPIHLGHRYGARIHAEYPLPAAYDGMTVLL